MAGPSGHGGPPEPGAAPIDPKVDFTPLPDSLKFESRFESGNLAKVIRITEAYYELYLRPDLYTTKHCQWFYFRVSSEQFCCEWNKYHFVVTVTDFCPLYHVNCYQLFPFYYFVNAKRSISLFPLPLSKMYFIIDAI